MLRKPKVLVTPLVTTGSETTLSTSSVTLKVRDLLVDADLGLASLVAGHAQRFAFFGSVDNLARREGHRHQRRGGHVVAGFALEACQPEQECLWQPCRWPINSWKPAEVWQRAQAVGTSGGLASFQSLKAMAFASAWPEARNASIFGTTIGASVGFGTSVGLGGSVAWSIRRLGRCLGGLRWSLRGAAGAGDPQAANSKGTATTHQRIINFFDIVLPPQIFGVVLQRGKLSSKLFAKHLLSVVMPGDLIYENGHDTLCCLRPWRGVNTPHMHGVFNPVLIFSINLIRKSVMSIIGIYDKHHMCMMAQTPIGGRKEDWLRTV